MSQSRAFSWRKAVVKSELNGECRHLLLTLSLYMNEMGQGAYPTLETLAKDCGKSLRWAKKWMKVAVDDGWIQIQKIRKYTENTDNRGWKRNEYFAAWPDSNVVIDDEVEVGNSDLSLDEISDEIAQAHCENGSAPDAPPSEKVVHEKQEGGAPDGKKVVHDVHLNSPVNQSSESVQKRESASAQENGLDENNSKPISKAELQKRLQRFVKGEGFKAGEWNGWAGSSIDYMLKHFGELSEDDRLSAEKWRDAYLRECSRQKTKPAPVGNYFKSKQWEYLSGDVMARSEQIDGVATKSDDVSKDGMAKPYSMPWMVWRMVHLLKGQEVAGIDCGSNPFRALKDRAWPNLSKFDNSVAQSRALQLPERFHANNDAMEWVVAGSDEWNAWKSMFERSKWPYIPNMQELDGANFPIGGPDGLHAFAKRMGIDWQAPDAASDGEV